jgi:hypothetical protein
MWSSKINSSNLRGDGSLVMSILGPCNHKRFWVWTQWWTCETPEGCLPLSLTLGCQWLVRWHLPFCFKKQFKQQCMARHQTIPCIQSAGKNSDGWPNFSEFAASTPIMESEIKIQCRLFRQSKTMAGQIACWQQWVEANVKKCKQL